MDLLQDVRHAVRRLRRTPSFTLVALATLGLGIGATTAIFSVFHAALLKALPYRDPDRLVHVFETESSNPSHRYEASFPDFTDIKSHSRVLEAAGYNVRAFTLETPGGAERVRGVRVSSGFFDVLGVEPASGRLLRPGDDEPGAEPVAVLGYGAWQRRFAADPAAVGQPITVGGSRYTVAGVLPRSFHIAPAGEPEVWVPLSPAPWEAERRFFHWVRVVARMKDGVSRPQVDADLSAVSKVLAEADPKWHSGAVLQADPLRDTLVGPARPVLFVLLGAVAFVLLIACANLANLLLAQAASRRREMAIRAALGADASRLGRQLLTESVLLGLLGGVVGLLWAPWAMDALVALVPASSREFLPYLGELGLHRGVLAFTFGVSLLTGIAFGLPAALRAAGGRLQDALADARGAAETLRPGLRDLLVASEVALALVLMTGAGLMSRSVARLLDVDPGFRRAGLLTASVNLPEQGYPDAARMDAFYSRLLERVRALPGVADAAAVDSAPLSGGGGTGVPQVEGRATPPDHATEASLRTVTTGYFRTMGLALRRGRLFEERDRQGGRVVLVNEALASRVLPAEDPVGRRVRFEFMDESCEIVGVVSDERVSGLDRAPSPVLYFFHPQDGERSMALVVRTSDPARTGALVRDELRAMDPAVPLSSVRTMDELVAASPAVFLRRVPAFLGAAFAALGLILASVGLYGVTSYTVSRRTREVGIRMALGARSADVLGMVLARGVLVAAAGVAAGLLASAALTRLMRGLLFGVSPTDPGTFAGVSAVLLVVAAAAAYLPARSATRVDPLSALRHE